jgi:hypothetical protein
MLPHVRQITHTDSSDRGGASTGFMRRFPSSAELTARVPRVVQLACPTLCHLLSARLLPESDYDWPSREAVMTAEIRKNKRSGPKSLFRGKVRKPVTLTLTPEHHTVVRKNRERLGITRADLIGLLIEKYAEVVTSQSPDAYKKLRNCVEVLGGRLDHEKEGEPRGGTWVLLLGGKCLRIPSEQAMRYPLLDGCYRLKAGVSTSRTWEDHTDVIDPAGLAQLFGQLNNRGDVVD